MKQFNSALHCVKSVHIRSYSGPYFPAFEMNTERYGVSLCIQPKHRKIRTRITPSTDTFHSVLACILSMSSNEFLMISFPSSFVFFLIMSLTLLYVAVIESRYRKRFIVFFLCYPNNVLTILTLKKTYVLYWIQYKNSLNLRLAASDVFHMFTRSINDAHMEELVLYWFSTKIHWNARLASSDVFHMFTQSIKVFFSSIIVQMSEKRDSSNRQ